MLDDFFEGAEKKKTLDDTALEYVKNAGPGCAVSWVLMASYIYYIKDETILTDATYDKLAKIVKDNYQKIKHQHKSLLTAFLTQTTPSLYWMKEEDYPLMTRSAAMRLLQGKQNG